MPLPQKRVGNGYEKNAPPRSLINLLRGLPVFVGEKEGEQPEEPADGEKSVGIRGHKGIVAEREILPPGEWVCRSGCLAKGGVAVAVASLPLAHALEEGGKRKGVSSEGVLAHFNLRIVKE